jgi:hypothetical protein
VTTVILVGCVKTKVAGTHPAKSLYASPLFNGRRGYAEATGSPWFILSARYGLVSPDAEIESYDDTLKTKSREQRRTWSEAVLARLDRELPRSATSVEIHAGKEYRDFGLVEGLERRGLNVAVPLRHLGMGQQVAWYRSVAANPELARGLASDSY